MKSLCVLFSTLLDSSLLVPRIAGNKTIAQRVLLISVRSHSQISEFNVG